MEKFYKVPSVLNYSSSGWIVANLNSELQIYYHHILQKNLSIKLNRPKFGCHVTVVAGKYEQVTHRLAWNRYQKQPLMLEYNSQIKNIGDTWWLEVRSQNLVQLRNELGLTDIPKWPFHITVANKKNIS